MTESKRLNYITIFLNSLSFLDYDTLFLKCEIELSDQDVIVKDQWGHFDDQKGDPINPTVLEDQPENIQIRDQLESGVRRAINCTRFSSHHIIT